VLSLLRRTALITAAALLVSCGSNNTANAPTTAPTNVAVSAGDTAVIVTWDMEPDLTYWIFSAAAPAITRENYNSFAGARITQPARSPRLITGFLNGRQYAFIINATRSGSAAGPASQSIAVIPRLAGNTWIAGTPLGPDLNAVGFGAGKYIAVGAGGALFTRGAGVLDTVWTAGTSGVTASLNGIVTGGTIVAVGDAGTILISGNATDWTAQTSGTTTRLNSVMFGQLTYIAVGDNGTILRSPDARTWTAVNSGTTSNLYGVAQLGNSLVAIGANGTLLTSADGGVVWTAGNSGTTATLRSLAAGTSRFVVVGDGGTILTSTDLTTWTAAASPTTQNLLRVSLGNQLVAVGTGGASVVSTDGLTWTAGNTGTTADLRGLVRGVNLDFLAVGTGGVNLVSR
jgi:hypothetical protein